MRIRNVPIRAAKRGWRLSGFNGFSFGTASQYANKDCTVGGDWDTWCNCVFTAGSDLNTRCRNKPFPVGLVAAPWTEVGAAARGLPKPGDLLTSLTSSGLQIISNITGGAVQGPPQPPLTITLPAVSTGNQSTVSTTSTTTPTTAGDEPSIFGIPKTIAYVGGGVLVLGVLALAFTK